MGLITITGELLQTVAGIAHSFKGSFTLDCEGSLDETRTVTNTYETLLTNSIDGRILKCVVLINPTANDVGVRLNLDNTNFGFLDLAPNTPLIIPLVVDTDAGVTNHDAGVIDIAARTIASTSQLLVFAFW